MNNLTQNYFLKQTSLSFDDHGLVIKNKGIYNSLEYKISFEELSDQVIYETKIDDGYKFGLGGIILFIIISALNKTGDMIALGVVALALALLLLYYTRDKIASLLLYDKRVLKINQKKPDEETVREFISEILLRRKNYLKSKYGTIDKDLPIESQLNNFAWLKNSNVINEEEFLNLKNLLLKNSNENKIGFK